MRKQARKLLLGSLAAAMLAMPIDASALTVKKKSQTLSLAKGVASSYQGSTGLIRVISPIILPQSTFSLLTHMRYWQQDSFLANDHFVRRLDTGGAFSISLNNYWEFFFTGLSSSHLIEDDILVTKTLLQSIGDFKTGVKAAYRLNSIFYMGADMYGRVPSSRGSIGPDFTAFSFGTDMLLALDWTGAPDPTPIRLTLNLGYLRDRTYKILPDGSNGDPSTNYGLGIPPDDDVWKFAFAVEVPQNFLNIFLEYSAEEYWDVNSSNEIVLPSGERRQLKRSYLENPQRLTPGIRLFPTHGMNIDLAIELGSPLFFTDAKYDIYQLGTLEEIMPNWLVHAGIGYTFLPPKPVAPKEGRVVGLVLDAKTRKPVRGALLSFPGKKLSSIVTNKMGEYRSYSFDEGPVRVAVSAKGYKNRTTSVTITATEEIRKDFWLNQNVRQGKLMVVIVDNQGHPVSSATLEFQNKNLAPLRPDAQSGLVEQSIEPGTYTIVVKAPGYQPKSVRVRIANKKTTKVTISLTPEKQVGKISGRVESLDGKPLGAVLTFTNGAPNVAVDPRTGQFSSTLGMGTYKVRATMDGYVDQSKTVMIEKDRITSVNFIMDEVKRTGKILGRVVDAKNGKGVFAVISFPNGEKGNVATDPESGKFVIELEAGTYGIKIGSPSYRSVTKKVTIKAGEDLHLSVPLKGYNKVKVTAEKIEISETIKFRTGKAIIKIGSYPVLDEVATVLKQNPEFNIVIEGHTDSQGSAKVNRRLSQQRAEAVRDYIVSRGIKTDRLKPVGYGEDQPIADNSSASGRAKNRRVEFRIIKSDKK